MFQATQKLKLFSILDDMRVAMPGLVDQLGSDYTDETILVRKSAPSEILEVEAASRIIVGKITTLDVDTYNEVVLPEGMDKTSYEKNNVVLWGHNYGDFLPHAECKWLRAYPTKSPVEIRAGTQYYEASPSALFPNNGEIYDYRSKRRPLGYSIGFIPKVTITQELEEWDDVLEQWQDRYSVYTRGKIKKADMPMPDLFYKDWVMLEYSDVVVPANPGAVAVYVEKGFIQAEEAEEYTLETEQDDLPPAKAGMEIDDPMPEIRKYVRSIIAEYDEEKAIVQKPGWDETETSYRFRVRDTEEFEDGSFRTVPIQEDPPRVNAVMGHLKGDDDMTIQSLIFPKEDDWTLDRAKAWLADHGDLNKMIVGYRVKTAIEEAFKNVPLVDIDINVPEALKDFKIAKLIAEAQGKLE